MPQKRRRDSIEVTGDTSRPPDSSAHSIEPSDRGQQPLFPSFKIARTSLFPASRHASAERRVDPPSTPAPETDQTPPSTTYSTPPTEPYHTPPQADPEFSSALASALSTTPSTTAFTPLATLLATQAITTPQLTLIHYHRAATPNFASHLDAAIVEAENDPAVQSRRAEVLAWRHEYERQMHYQAWEGWRAEWLERSRRVEKARREVEEAKRREREEVRRRTEAEKAGREAVRRNRERWERMNRRG